MFDFPNFLLPVFSRKVPYAEWRDQDDVGKWFREQIVEAAKEFLVSERDIRTTVNVLGVEKKSSKKLGRAHPQLVQYTVDIHGLVGSHEERDVIGAFMPGFLREIQAFSVVTVMDSWAVIGHDVSRWYEDHESLSEHPAAQEALTILWEHGGKAGALTFPISREGENIELGESITPEGPGLNTTGRFINWLSDPPRGVN